jgi:pimeloyl-ACP methyl ester carboxylesterase
MPRIDIADLSVHYEESGMGVPVILLHGHPLDATMWLPQLQAHFPGHRLIAPDLRNFGTTTSPHPPANFAVYASDVLALADALSLSQFIVAGLSMGGHVAMEIAAIAPHRLFGLILADTYAPLDNAQKKSGRLALADRIDAEGIHGYAAEALPKLLSPTTLAQNPQLASDVLQMMHRQPAAGASAALRVRADHRDYMPILSAIDIPTLIVVGSEDQFTPIADAVLMHQTIPHSTLIVIEGSGHMSNLEQPNTFNDALQKFLDTLQSAN